MLFPGIVKAFDFFCLENEFVCSSCKFSGTGFIVVDVVDVVVVIAGTIFVSIAFDKQVPPLGYFSLSKVEISQIFTLKNVPRTSISVRFRRCSATVAIY